MPIFTSPDNGHTIYQDTPAGKTFVSEDAHAQKRRRLRHLQQVITLADRDARVLEYLEHQLESVMTYAVMCGHDVQNWKDYP
jgi:hypothetical protein